MARKCSLAGGSFWQAQWSRMQFKSTHGGPGSTRDSCSSAGGTARTRENDPSNPRNDQLQVGHSHLTLKGIFLDVGRERT